MKTGTGYMLTTKNSPRDAQVMAAILKDMGISEYEPRVINLMLEFTYRKYCERFTGTDSWSYHRRFYLDWSFSLPTMVICIVFKLFIWGAIQIIIH